MLAYNVIRPSYHTAKMDCIICLDELHANTPTEQKDICETTCKHYFHKPCIDEWLSQEWQPQAKKCPICRNVLEQVDRPVRNINGNVPEPRYQTTLTPLLPNPREFFQNLVNQSGASQNITLQDLKDAIKSASENYLTWRGNGRELFHKGNTGRNRALKF